MTAVELANDPRQRDRPLRSSGPSRPVISKVETAALTARAADLRCGVSVWERTGFGSDMGISAFGGDFEHHNLCF